VLPQSSTLDDALGPPDSRHSRGLLWVMKTYWRTLAKPTCVSVWATPMVDAA